MQHRAPTQVRGRHRRTDPTLPGGPSDGLRAYRELLASTGPLTPADARGAYQDLLASAGKLSPAAVSPAADPTPRRRDVASHRAPAKPLAPALLGERGRYAVAAAAIAAGVGVAGVSAATTAGAGAAGAVTTQARTQAAAHTELTPSPSPTASTSPSAGTSPNGTSATTAAESYTAAAATLAPDPVPGSADAALGAVRAARKARPIPVAQWADPMPGSVTTSCFGERWGRLHAGVDLAAPHGTPVHSAGAGVVVRAGVADGYGNAVLIDHGNGYLTHYGHLSAITVTEGRRLTAGEQIGNEGSTGHSTGPHLHFEVHEGTYKNPIEPTAWMHEHGVDIGGCDQP